MHLHQMRSDPMTPLQDIPPHAHNLCVQSEELSTFDNNNFFQTLKISQTLYFFLQNYLQIFLK